MFRCKYGHEGDYIVYPSVPEEIYNLDGMGIIVNSRGEMTNRFEDGVIGVPDKLREFVEEEMEAVCATCMREYARTHRHLSVQWREDEVS